MKRAWDGFFYPEIDTDKCVQCGLCIEVCDFSSFCPTGREPDCYAVRHKDVNELLTSRSGGFFMLLCEYVVQHQGVVFGCEIDDNLHIYHRYRETYEGCKRFKGSKYVQSDLKNTFCECEAFLRGGKMVLFSGTGCQVHGLISYLHNKKINTEKLITVDLVCHGAPSPGVWDTFTDLLESEEGSRIYYCDFRDKESHAWHDHVEKYVFQNGSRLFLKKWTSVFYRNILFRESCYECKYTTTQRKTDFTMADYWGVKENVPEFDDDKGCSLVLVHTEKGKRIFSEIENNASSVKTELSRSLQPQLCHPVWKGWDRMLFWNCYKINRNNAVRIWFFSPLFCKYLHKVESFFKRQLKKILSK